MKGILTLVFVSLLLVIAARVSRADTLVLQDGTRITGVLVQATAQTVTFKDSSGVVRTFDRSQIQSLQIETINQPAVAPVVQSSQTAAASNKSSTLPVGTAIVVQTNEAIDSASATKNQVFSAQVSQDVLDRSKNVVILKGSPAELVIRTMSSGGVTGSPEMTLDIQAITVGTQRYLVSTANLSRKNETGIGKNKRTAEAVGGGAALGTLLGAMAGKGKGAAIGAVVGAAAGAGTQVLIKGKEVRVPAETVLRFTLNQPVTLQPAQ